MVFEVLGENLLGLIKRYQVSIVLVGNEALGLRYGNGGPRCWYVEALLRCVSAQTI